jgi:iron complex outermembrane recepter protein
MNKKFLTTIILAILGVPAQAQEKNQTQQDSIKKLNEISVNGTQKKYKREKSATVSKMPLSDIENPQVYNSVTAEVLKEQVTTNFNDAIKNATGITRLWESTGRGGDGAEFFSMRGFAVQPSMINALPALNNGTIDISNVDNIEVIKGPSGTLFGSSLISYGGLINIVTKKPIEKLTGEISYNSGSYGLNRVSSDINIPLDTEKNALLRINTAYQKENSFQDAGFNQSFFIAPVLSYKINDKLSFLINTEFTNRRGSNAPMLFLSRYAPISFDSMELFEKNYKNSFTSNELAINNPTFSLQVQMFNKLSDKWTSQTVLSRSTSKTDGYYSYLWDSSNGNDFTRFISKRNGETLTTDIQQNFIGDFNFNGFRNRIVVGLDYFKSDIINGSTGWVTNGTVSLTDGNDTGDLTQAGVDNLLVGSSEGNTTAESEVFSAYFSDVINFLPNLSAMASLRIDRFEGKTNYYSTTDVNGQTAVSPKFGLVYQPIENKVSLFANYMNGFKNVEPQGQGVNQKTFDAEHADQFEIGTKTNLFNDKLSLTVSYYNIIVKDKVMSDPNDPNNSIQGGEVKSRGIEVSLIANPFKGLNVIAGFGNNHSEVTKDFPTNGYLGLRPEEAGPETLINFWANYTINEGSLKGFGIGFGGNHASENKTINRAVIGTFTLPSYTILNTALSYNHSKFNIALKLNNILNEKYYTGWSTVSPQRLRNITAGLTYKF